MKERKVSPICNDDIMLEGNGPYRIETYSGPICTTLVMRETSESQPDQNKSQQGQNPIRNRSGHHRHFRK